MRIQHNIMAMGAYRNYTNNVNAMKKNLEKLSSGYKINRAGDDAAGLAISEKMRAQITGLETAQKNAKDGISLVQTAEGALTEVHDMLNRMVTLATQSANGTYDNDTDRVQLEKELNQLKSEIDRIADSSNFNGIKLLDGTQASKSTVAAELGKLTASSLIDGTKPSKAGSAEVTVTFGSGNSGIQYGDPNQLDAVTDATKTYDGNNKQVATHDTLEFTVANTTTAATAGSTDVTFTVASATKAASSTTFQIDATNNNTKIGNVTVANTTTVADIKAAKDAGGTTDLFGASGAYTLTITKADGSAVADDATLDGTETITISAKDGTTATASLITNGVNTADGKTMVGSTAIDTDSTGTPTTIATLTTALSDYDIVVTNGSGTVKDNTTDSFADGDVVTLRWKGTGTALDPTADISNTAAGVTEAATTLGIGNTAVELKAGTVDLSTAEDANGLLSNSYDLYVNDTKVTDWTNVTLTNTSKVKLQSKTAGTSYDATTGSAANVENGLKALVGNGKGVTATAGKDIDFGTPTNTNANYVFTVDVSKLAGGQRFLLGDTTNTPQEVKIVNDSSTGAGIVNINGQTEAQIVTALENAFGTFTDGDGTAYTVTSVDNGDGTHTFTLTADDAAEEAGNQGALRVDLGIDGAAAGSDQDPIVGDIAYNRFVDAGAPVTNDFAKVTYQSDDLKGTVAEDTMITIGDLKVHVVADGISADDLAALKAADNDPDMQYVEQADLATKLADLVEEKANIDCGKVDYDATTGELSFEAAEAGAGQLDALKAATAVSVALPVEEDPTATPATVKSEGGITLTLDQDTIADLKGKEITLTTGEKVKVGDVFDIVDADGNAITDGTTISSNVVLKFQAKQVGKLDANVMKAVNFPAKLGTGDTATTQAATTEIKEGWDEGETGAGTNTHYDLTIATNKLAGGNTFTFGNVNGKSYTFDISYDPNATGNGSINGEVKEEVSGDNTRVTINLSASMTEDQIRETIKKAVEDKMGTDFNVKATGTSSIKLELDAKNGGEQYNLGQLRYSSESGALSGNYKPYSSTSSGVEGG